MTKKAGEGKGGFSHPAFKGNLFKKTSLSYLDICINHRRISTSIPNATGLYEILFLFARNDESIDFKMLIPEKPSWVKCLVKKEIQPLHTKGMSPRRVFHSIIMSSLRGFKISVNFHSTIMSLR